MDVEVVEGNGIGMEVRRVEGFRSTVRMDSGAEVGANRKDADCIVEESREEREWVNNTNKKTA